MENTPLTNNEAVATTVTPTPVTAASTSEPPQQQEQQQPYRAVCMAMSNDNLLKMNTQDNFATDTALKKIISSTCRAAGISCVGNFEKGELLFPGMLRCSKNPKNPVIFFSFDTTENRENAKKIMETHLKHRKHQPWVEVPVNDKDLQMTFRGAAGLSNQMKTNNIHVTAGSSAANNNTAEGGDYNNNNNNNSAPSNRSLKREAREGDKRTSNTAQWAAYPYQIQIGKKASHCKSIIRQIASGRLQRMLSPYGCPQLLEQFSMIESPFLSGYRNHVNFTCGYDHKRRPVIGFVSGAVTDGLCSVEDVTGRWFDKEKAAAETAAAASAAGPSSSSSSSSSPSSAQHLLDGAPLVPPTTNVLSVAYVKAVMDVVAKYENVEYADDGESNDEKSSSTVYCLGMLDKAQDAPSSPKRGPRSEGSATTATATTSAGDWEAVSASNDDNSGASSPSEPRHVQYWRRVQIRHSTVGEVMVDLEVDPSAVPAGLHERVKQDLTAALRAVEASYDGEKAEAEERAFLEFAATVNSSNKNNKYNSINKNSNNNKKSEGNEPSSDAANDTTTADNANVAEKEVEKEEAKTSNNNNNNDDDDNDAAKPDSHRVVTALKRPQPLVIPSSKLVSLQLHYHTGSTMCPHEAPREIIYGSPTLVENLCGMKFLLSPPSFFQVNTPTTERMLQRVADVAQLKPTTTLLDLCCGTGIIGICLSKYVKKIVGIEMVVSATENAKVNAANNGVTEKTTYYAAKVEDALQLAMNAMTFEEKQDIVAIFDPPRAGMHPSVLCAVRAIPQIRRIVYISCDQQALIRDCPSLMKEPTKKFRGTPYVIENTFGIDLFPHTPHVEMVVVLNKTSNEQLQKYYDQESKYRVKGEEEAVATSTATSALDELANEEAPKGECE